MRVSDEAIMAYLEQLSAELLSRAEIGEIFQRALGGRMSEAQLFEILRTELLAQNYIIMLHPSLFLARGEAVTPYTAWQYHERLRRRVKAEVAPLEVASFKSQVKTEPTSAQIQALYEEGKDRYPDPERPEPGFRVPRKIAFQFVRGDVSAFEQQELDAARKAVTDEEIKQHYEANKQRYTVQPTAPPSGPAAPSLPAAPQPGSETPAPPAAAPTTDSGSAPAAPAPSPPSGDAATPPSPPPAAPQTPAAPDSAAPAPSEPAPSEPAPSEPAPSEPAPSEPAPSEPAPSPAPPTGDPASGAPPAASEQPAPVENPPAATGSDNSGANRVTATDTVFVRLLEEASAESQPPAANAPADAAAPTPETGAAATGETPAPAAETPAGTDAAAPVAEKPEPAAAAPEGTAAAEPAAPPHCSGGTHSARDDARSCRSGSGTRCGDTRGRVTWSIRQQYGARCASGQARAASARRSTDD